MRGGRLARQGDVELEPAALSLLRHLERRDPRTESLDLVDDAAGRLADGKREEQCEP
jgi:hypothetical protein